MRPAQTLNFLLPADAVDLVRPNDEIEDLDPSAKETVTNPQWLCPLKEPGSAVMLSWPISHRLGLCSIRTLLNAPGRFQTPTPVANADANKGLQTLHHTRTRHKDKTAKVIGQIAGSVAGNDWSNGLQKVRGRASETVEKELEVLQSKIKKLNDRPRHLLQETTVNMRGCVFVFACMNADYASKVGFAE
ncbi:hypothetical protein EJ04DRAFT_579663 [Polyplosphaeria fusca]|uniref:Uncharacterized protein n=1 Tax=Polyplosphaeria fusca TaxID=682080 RepID=A0A9P4QS93_9PLEO|nr:hypothetical protein EJ04DRAFT_579663 [Polyplosphaeria fusca]